MTIGGRVTAMLVAVATTFLICAAAATLSASPALAGTNASPALAGTNCDFSQPTVCAAPGKVIQLVPAGNDTCALTDQGTVYCWAEADESRRPVTNFSLLLITIGSILVAGGAGLVLISRP